MLLPVQAKIENAATVSIDGDQLVIKSDELVLIASLARLRERLTPPEAGLLTGVKGVVFKSERVVFEEAS